MHTWTDAHFGVDDLDAPIGGTDDFGGDVDFGFDPLTLTVLGLGAVGALSATAHHALSAHHLLMNGRPRHAAHAPRSAHRASASAHALDVMDSDGELEALSVAAHTDPYALGQPL